MSDYAGILAIGDPHLASRTLDFRRDDYGRVSLDKFKWCLNHASERRLLPVVLGDLFHYARDNANWLLGELLSAFAVQEVVGIYGNHDCRENALGPDDSLSVLVSAGHFRLLTLDEPWTGSIDGAETTLYGVSWGRSLPNSVPQRPGRGVMVTHHDVRMPGYEEAGRFGPFEIEGVELVVNGHIHRRLEERRAGTTLWVNPGNICRVKRSDASRDAVPSVLRLSPAERGWERVCVEIPHDSYESVFHEHIGDEPGSEVQSEFVRGLAELQAYRTQDGAGLRQFLDLNLPEFEPSVRAEIEELASEVLADK